MIESLESLARLFSILFTGIGVAFVIVLCVQGFASLVCTQTTKMVLAELEKNAEDARKEAGNKLVNKM